MPGAHTKMMRGRFYFVIAAIMATAALILFCPNRSNPQFLNNGGRYFNLPNFCGDPFVFVRSNMIWKTDLMGSNLVRLFPPVPGRR
jgi:hypothetical protein